MRVGCLDSLGYYLEANFWSKTIGAGYGTVKHSSLGSGAVRNKNFKQLCTKSTQITLDTSVGREYFFRKGAKAQSATAF